MLWSLVKIVLFMVVVSALGLGAVYLLESSGSVTIRVMGREYSFGPLQSVIAALVLVVLVWLLLKLVSLLVATLKFLNGDETALSRHFNRSRERKGFDALAEGMMALASGEGRLAMAKAERARRYLNKPEVTDLLTAQAAEMAGDRRKAEATYRKLVRNTSTRFVGVRGIMMQKLADGDTDTAMQLAKKAFALKPRHEETQDVLLRLQARAKDWTGARATLGAKLKHGSMPRDLHRRRDAVLALSKAKSLLADGKIAEARDAAIEANRLSPDLTPAAVMAARSLIEQGMGKKAAKLLTKAWDKQPHPDLAAAFAEIAPNETPDARIKRFAQLTRSMPDHPETRMLLAELHIAAEDFPAARRALGDLVQSQPTTRSVTIMAAIERGEGASDTVVKGWLAKALTVSRGPQWVCENCHQLQDEWVAICENCEGFDTLTWKTPPRAEVSTPTGVQMLPLIVGALDDRSSDQSPGDDDGGMTTDTELFDGTKRPDPERN